MNDGFDAAFRALIAFLYPDRPETADKLILRFGTAAGVINAGRENIEREGISEHNSLLISMLPDIARHIKNENTGEHPVISGFDAARDFLLLRFLGSTVESFYMLALNDKGALIECVKISGGDENTASLNLRRLLKEVVRLNAAAVIISHNHPDGTLRPSRDDIECTLRLINALQPLNAPLLDHIIMSGKTAVSMRKENYISEARFIAQSPAKLVREYVKG